jgi:hypothetical protein
MKTYTIKTYLFNELSEDAQRAAWENDPHAICCDYFDGERRATLKAFERIFNISVQYSVDSCRHTFDYFKPCENGDEISDPLRLACYVWNNYAQHIKKGKYYSTRGEWIDGRYNYKYRYSKITHEMDNCPLTGVCYDCDILQPVIDCLLYKEKYSTLEDLITAALNDFFRAWRADLEYIESFEYYKEEAENNAWEYLRSGRRFEGVAL